MLDIKKPDYALIRQQLELAYAGEQVAPFDGNLFAEPQWQSRVFGKLKSMQAEL